jgi:cytochrome c oxidase subunit 3
MFCFSGEIDFPVTKSIAAQPILAGGSDGHLSVLSPDLSTILYSTFIVLISSITAYYAYKMAKQDELSANKYFLLGTLGLGILFCLSQYLGWQQMVNLDLTFVNARPEDISASYVWVITLLHFVHILGGIGLIFATWIQAIRLNVHKKSMLLMSITHTYWHFVGLLWILLYLFLYFAQ